MDIKPIVDLIDEPQFADVTIASAWEPVSLLDKVIWGLHENMDAATELEYLAGLRRYATIKNGQANATCSAYAGTDFKAHIDDALSKIWKIRYNIVIEFKHTIKAEIRAPKQTFLRHQFDAGSFILVNDVAELLGDEVYDTNAKAMALMPYFNHLAAGIPCTSRTPLSSKAKENVNCVQSGTAATGTASAHVLRICEKHLPGEVACECVTNLQQRTNPSDMSDAEFITSKLQGLGYWALHTVLCSKTIGSPFPRERLWWVALRELQGASDSISHFFLSLLAEFKLPAKLELSEFFTLDDQQREECAEYMGVPSLAQCGLREPKNAKAEPEYKLDHMSYFRAQGKEWPVPSEDWPRWRSVIDMNGMLPREREVAIFVHSVWPDMGEGRQMEFLDVNFSLPRLVDPCIDDDDKLKKSPWLACILWGQISNNIFVGACINGTQHRSNSAQWSKH